MQRFAIVLLAFVALFAIFAPSSVNALSHVKRETNADRFARGLPPLAPSRRSTAKRHHNSQVSVPYALTLLLPLMVFSSAYPFPVECSHSGRLQVRDHGNGQSLGYLQNAPSGPYVHLSPSTRITLGSLDALVTPFISGGINTGNNPDLSVQYNPKDHSITCVVSILGAIVSRQFLIPRIGLAIQSRRILPWWTYQLSEFKSWVPSVSFDIPSFTTGPLIFHCQLCPSH
jgi:hypothetical protein